MKFGLARIRRHNNTSTLMALHPRTKALFSSNTGWGQNRRSKLEQPATESTMKESVVF